MSEPPAKKRFPTFRYHYLNPQEQEGVVAEKISGDALPGDGQLLIGSSGADPVAATLSAGDGISITNEPGSVTISNTNVVPNLEDGQVLIGATGTAPTATNITAGSNISVTNGPGSITINADQEPLPLQHDGELLIGLTGNSPVATTLTAGVGINISNGPASVTINADQEPLPILNDGQLFIGSTGLPPSVANLTGGAGITVTNGTGEIEIKASDTVIHVTSATDAVSTSLTDVVINDMIITPGFGNFIIMFHGSFTVTDDATDVSISIYKNGVKIPCCEAHNSAVKNAPSMEHIGTMAYVTNLISGDEIDIRWRISRGTGTFKDRMLICQKIFT